ncbi:MAG: hypothetical protein QOK07_3220 [Gemmatimonadaceae bacterium]|jgi:hypothetical protein|nr:hypothetical protein [Gemmatimonadaceae bacterium]
MYPGIRLIVITIFAGSLIGCISTRNYVSTPNGFLYRDCIYKINQGDRVSDQGVITHPDGKTTRLVACKHARLDNRTFHWWWANDEKPLVHTWVEDARWSGPILGGLTATFKVPPLPQPLLPGQAEALIYLFPGIQDQSTILQPVLQYGKSDAFPDNEGHWIAASWYCCPGGHAIHTDPIKVSPGDEITGTITAACANCQDSALPCSTTTCNWSVTTSATTTTSKSVVMLPAGPVTGSFQTAVGGVLETWGLTNCAQLPRSCSTVFSDIIVTNQAGKPLVPWWMPEHIVEPQCRFGVSSTKDTVTLSY